MSTSAAPEPITDPPADPTTGVPGTGAQPDNGGMPSSHVEEGVLPMNGGMPSSHVEGIGIQPHNGGMPSSHVEQA